MNKIEKFLFNMSNQELHDTIDRLVNPDKYETSEADNQQLTQPEELGPEKVEPVKTAHDEWLEKQKSYLEAFNQDLETMTDDQKAVMFATLGPEPEVEA